MTRMAPAIDASLDEGKGIGWGTELEAKSTQGKICRAIAWVIMGTAPSGRP